MARKKREQPTDLRAEAERIANTYPPDLTGVPAVEPMSDAEVTAALETVALAKAKAERARLLNPPGVGYGGTPHAPLAAGELEAESRVISAMALDRSDANERLTRIRAWLLDDPTFERDLWASIREKAIRYGARHCLNAILRLVYNWQENDNIAEKLGATLDEARRSLNVTSEVSRMSEHDIAENVITFCNWYREEYPDRWGDFLGAIKARPQ